MQALGGPPRQVAVAAGRTTVQAPPSTGRRRFRAAAPLGGSGAQSAPIVGGPAAPSVVGSSRNAARAEPSDSPGSADFSSTPTPRDATTAPSLRGLQGPALQSAWKARRAALLGGASATEMATTDGGLAESEAHSASPLPTKQHAGSGFPRGSLEHELFAEMHNTAPSVAGAKAHSTASAAVAAAENASPGTPPRPAHTRPALDRAAVDDGDSAMDSSLTMMTLTPMKQMKKPLSKTVSPVRGDAAQEHHNEDVGSSSSSGSSRDSERPLAAIVQEKITELSVELSAQRAVSADLAAQRDELAAARKTADADRIALDAWIAEQRAEVTAWAEAERAKVTREVRVAVRQAKAQAAAEHAPSDRTLRLEVEELRATVARLRAEASAADARYRDTVERHRLERDAWDAARATLAEAGSSGSSGRWNDVIHAGVGAGPSSSKQSHWDPSAAVASTLRHMESIVSRSEAYSASASYAEEGGAAAVAPGSSDGRGSGSSSSGLARPPHRVSFASTVDVVSVGEDEDAGDHGIHGDDAGADGNDEGGEDDGDFDDGASPVVHSAHHGSSSAGFSIRGGPAAGAPYASNGVTAANNDSSLRPYGPLDAGGSGRRRQHEHAAAAAELPASTPAAADSREPLRGTVGVSLSSPLPPSGLSARMQAHLNSSLRPDKLGAGAHADAAAAASAADGAPPALTLLSEQRSSSGAHLVCTYSDGSRVVIYRNGTEKETRGDGTTIVRFANGDVRRFVPVTARRGGGGDGLGSCEIYRYASSNTVQTTYSAGVDVFEFPSGQTELWRREGEGPEAIIIQEILFPNGVSRTLARPDDGSGAGIPSSGSGGSSTPAAQM